MKIRYLPSSNTDIEWFREYFGSIVPDGHVKAYSKFQLMEKLLLENPYLGYMVAKTGTRELLIPKTHFSFIYKIDGDCIEVLRIWDDRRARNF